MPIVRHRERNYFETRIYATFADTNVVGNVYFANYVFWQGKCRETFFADGANGFMPPLPLYDGVPLNAASLTLAGSTPAEDTQFEVVGEFLSEVDQRLEKYGSAFHDLSKGRKEEALSNLQTVKLKEIAAKARGKKRKGLTTKKPLGWTRRSRPAQS